MLFPFSERRLVCRSTRHGSSYESSAKLSDSTLVAKVVADAFQNEWAVLSVETAKSHKKLDARALHQGGDGHQYHPRVMWSDAQPISL